MARRGTGVLILAGAAYALMGSDAYAQTFGRAGQFAVSGERLMGFVISSQTSEEGGVETTNTFTNISLLSNPLHSVSTSYSFARLGGDYFVGDGISIGGALAYFTVSGNTEVSGQGVSVDQDTGTGNGFIVAPRVGYAHMFSDSAGIWPRGGITYLGGGSENDEGTIETSSTMLALTIEAPLVLTPAPHAAILLGPTLDLGLSGSQEVTVNGTSNETDVKGTDWGVQGGVMIWF